VITIGLEKSKVDALNANLSDFVDGIEVATVAALNDAAFATRSQMVQVLYGTVATDQDRIAAKVTVQRASAANADATIRISDKPISIKHFEPEQAKKGVYYRPSRNGSRAFVRGGFGPNINRLGRDVFVRVGNSRTPIKRVPGVNLATESEKLGLDVVAGEFFGVAFRVLLKRRLSRSIFFRQNKSFDAQLIWQGVQDDIDERSARGLL